MRRSFIQPLVLVASALALNACASGYDSTPDIRASQLATGYNPIRSPEDETSPFICPTEANIKPHHDTELDGQGQYATCYARSSLYQIRVDATVESPPDKICVFPIQYVDSTTSYLKPDLQTGRPLSVCAGFVEGRSLFDFDLIRYNALIVVPEASREAMTSCLESGQAWACPAYSYGKFRD